MVVLRGRVFQVGAAVSVALLGLLAVTLGWAAIQYRQFSADISQSRNRLPASVGRALPAAPPGALDAPEVTLVRYTAGLSTGGAVLFFTDPKRRLMSFLALPPSTHIGSRSLARLDVPTTIAALRASTAVRVDHVALIDRSDVGSLVSGLGGITITNPDVVRETQPDGRVTTVGRGRISLDGPGAVAYLAGAGTGEPLENASMAVLGGIFKELLRPNSVGTLDAAGSALASSASTDLTDADVLGLAYLRVNGGTALQCHLERKSGPHLDPRDQRTGAVPGLQTAGPRMRAQPLRGPDVRAPQGTGSSPSELRLAGVCVRIGVGTAADAADRSCPDDGRPSTTAHRACPTPHDSPPKCLALARCCLGFCPAKGSRHAAAGRRRA